MIMKIKKHLFLIIDCIQSKTIYSVVFNAFNMSSNSKSKKPIFSFICILFFMANGYSQTTSSEPTKDETIAWIKSKIKNRHETFCDCGHYMTFKEGGNDCPKQFGDSTTIGFDWEDENSGYSYIDLNDVTNVKLVRFKSGKSGVELVTGGEKVYSYSYEPISKTERRNWTDNFDIDINWNEEENLESRILNAVINLIAYNKQGKSKEAY